MSDYEEQQRAADKIPDLTTNVPVQYGQVLEMEASATAGGGQLANVAKDVIRWKGIAASDIQPLRIYLGPWQPKADLVPIAPGFPTNYIADTPWTSFPPFVYDSMLREGFSATGGMLYARISFGAGGVQHQAYVDWPPRGLLCQVVANYVQVDGVGRIVADFEPPSVFPVLLAHVGPEPGGGDAINSATFTYPFSELGTTFMTFQVPPFARSFTPLLDRRQLENLGGAWIEVVQLSNQLTANVCSHVWESTVGGDWPDDRGIPLSGYTSALRVNLLAIGGGAPGGTLRAGMMFHLDL